MFTLLMLAGAALLLWPLAAIQMLLPLHPAAVALIGLLAALAFCRERYAFASGDRQRGRNQMALIQAVIRKAASPAILSNYGQVLASAAGTGRIRRDAHLALTAVRFFRR